MKNTITLIVFCFLSCLQNLFAGKVTVSGKNQEYANETITFNTYENFITWNENKIAVITTDSTGTFKFQVNIYVEFVLLYHT